MKKNLLSLFIAAAVAASAADVSINSLPAIGNVTSSTVLPVVDVSGTPTTKKATVTQLVAGLPAATSTTVGTMSAADKLKLDNATASNTPSTVVTRDSSGNFAAATITASKVTGLSAPTADTDAANKSYVDASSAGLTIKTPAVAGTIGANITLSGGAPNTLDGVTLSLNVRVLVKDQTDPTQNGIYYVSTLGTGSNGTWTRTTDADIGTELITGTYIFITGGTVNVNASYTMTTPGTITIGVSNIVWNIFSQVTQIQASSIVGQIVAAQVADAAINTAKFASGLTPVEILGTLPASSNFVGRTVFLTSDSKLYRYNGSAFVNAVPTSDLTGTIGTTQITDNAITSNKVLAGSITAGKIGANAVTSGTIAANAVTAGTIAVGAVTATEIAAGAINASKIAAGTITATEIAANTITGGKIAAGTITADKLTVTSLSAINANLGTVTAGSLTANSTISVGTGKTKVDISGSQFKVGDISVKSYSAIGTEISATTGDHNAYMYSGSTGSGIGVQNTLTGSQILLFDADGELRINDGKITLSTNSTIQGPGKIDMNADSLTKVNISAGETGAAGTQIGYWQAWLNGRRVLIPIYNLP